MFNNGDDLQQCLSSGGWASTTSFFLFLLGIFLSFSPLLFPHTQIKCQYHHPHLLLPNTTTTRNLMSWRTRWTLWNHCRLWMQLRTLIKRLSLTSRQRRALKPFFSTCYKRKRCSNTISWASSREMGATAGSIVDSAFVRPVLVTCTDCYKHAGSMSPIYGIYQHHIYLTV